MLCLFFFFSSRRRHTISYGDWSSDVCSSDLAEHREWMSMMLKAAQQLQQLLDEVLDISRSDSGELSLTIDAVPVQDVITDALELIRPLGLSRGIHLDPPPRLPAT